MPIRLPRALLLAALLSACAQPTTLTAPPTPVTTAPTTPATPGLSRSIGRVEVTFSGVGSTFYATSVRDLTPGLTGQALTRAASGLQLRFNSKGSFDVGVPGTGTRYLHATYDVRNASFDGATPSSTPRSNLTFIAVDATAPATIAGSAVRNLKRFDGSDADPSLATSIIPLHGMMSQGGVPTVNASLADFMAFTEAEASSLGAVADVTSVLPYGYVVRSKLSAADRTLPADPAAGQFDGQVTFAVKLPLQANPANDPFTFSLVFEVVEDNQTRVTKTAEESVSAAQSRATALGATQVSADTVCRVRVAGSAAAPTSVLTGLGSGPSGTLDGCFGTGGKVMTPVGAGTSEDQARAVRVQADGKIVVAGETSNVGGTSLARYTTDGTLDPTFGGGTGTVSTPLAFANALSLQADGKIVVAGSASGGATSTDFALARYNTDGTLDTTFGGGTGTVITPVGAGNSSDQANALSLQADGKIVVAGSAYDASETAHDFALVRYTTDGTLDATFGGGTGTVMTPVGADSSRDFAYALGLQADGKIVLAGSTSSDGSDDFALVRYTMDGTLDTTFGGGTGKVITPVSTGSGDDRVQALSVQTDGKIVAAGSAFVGVAGQDFTLVRYDTDGTLDTTFGGGTGTVSTHLGAGYSVELLQALSVQGDGKIVAAGSARSGTTGLDFALARYNMDGTLDATFGGGTGKVLIPVGAGTSTDIAYALTLQADGKLVAAGSARSGTTGLDFALVRVLP